MCSAGALAIGGFGGSRCGLRRTRGSYGFCLADSTIVRLWEWKGRVVSEGGLSFGQEQRVWGRGLYIEVSGGLRAEMVDRDTKATGVDDSVRGSEMEGHLGGVKLDPRVYELGGVPGRKRFDSHHGCAAMRTTEACREMGRS